MSEKAEKDGDFEKEDGDLHHRTTKDIVTPDLRYRTTSRGTASKVTPPSQMRGEASQMRVDMSDTKWQNLQNLKQLLDAGYLTKTEFAERKAQLIDQMTGTTLGRSTGVGTMGTIPTGRSVSIVSRNNRMDGPAMALPTIIPKPPPDFAIVTPEKAIKFEYDLTSKTWQETEVIVKIDPVPFSRGALRLVYHLQDMNLEEQTKKKKTEGKESQTISYVAKISMDPRDNKNREIYFRDVEMQTVAKYYASKFNEYHPPKKVDFVAAWLLRLESREGTPMCGVERYIDGTYRKHNNNFGYVSEEERNTPQAFSHFTYECSSHKLLVCDIQGVSDMYTDPQVHSADGKGFGKGNMGQAGIDEFLRTHRCNAICRYLKLPPFNPMADLGTLPVQRIMSYERVEIVHLGDFPAEFPNPTANPRAPLVARKTDGSQSLFGCCIIL